MGFMYRSTRRRRAQGMTEYIIIVGLIAVLLIAVVQRFGQQIDVTIQGSTDATNNTVGNPIRQRAAQSSGAGSGTRVNPTNPRPAGQAADGTQLFQDNGTGPLLERAPGGGWVTSTKAVSNP